MCEHEHSSQTNLKINVSNETGKPFLQRKTVHIDKTGLEKIFDPADLNNKWAMSFIVGLFITDLVSFVFGTTMPELSLWTVAEYTTTDIV